MDVDHPSPDNVPSESSEPSLCCIITATSPPSAPDHISPHDEPETGVLCCQFTSSGLLPDSPVCRLGRLKLLRRRENLPTEDIPLGSYFEMRRRASYCAVANLIVAALRRHWFLVNDAALDNELSIESVQIKLNSETLRLQLTCKDWAPNDSDAINYTGVVRLAFLCKKMCGDCADCGDTWSVTIGEEELDYPSRGAPLVAAIPDSIVDPSLVHTWLTVCSTCHTDLCQREVLRNQGKLPTSFRVIDVQDMCLVDGEKRYLALSYVWGNAQSVVCHKTTKNNIRMRYIHGSLRLLPLSRTIDDAMEFTRRIGERYLWVDSICIVQDDAEDKHAQILGMHHIYGAAYATIVAATGQWKAWNTDEPTNADYPLPRSCERSSLPIHREVAVIGDKFCTTDWVRLSDIEAGIARQTPWFERGWTWQEERMSPRLIYFTDHGVTFRCMNGIDFNEGGPTEYEALRKRAPPRWAMRIMHFQRARVLRGITAPDIDLTSMTVYSNLVTSYSERRLTFEEDLLDAFAGVPTAWSDFDPHFGMSDCRTFYGLSGQYLVLSMLWYFEQRSSDSLGLGMLRRYQWPSWSWIGWSHQIGYGKFLAKPDIPGAEYVTRDMRLHTEGGQQILVPKQRQLKECAGANDPTILDRDYGRLESGAVYELPLMPAIEPGTRLRASKWALPSGTLEFLAVTAPANAFKVSRHWYHKGAGRPLVEGAMQLMRIHDKDGHQCGVIFAGDAFLEAEPLDSDWAFVCMVKQEYRFDWGTSMTWKDTDGVECFPDHDFIEFRFDDSVYDRDYNCIWQVLLVRFGAGGIAERVTVAMIHERAWSEVERLRWERIYLR